MQKGIIQFVISALLGLGIGYLAFDVIGDKESSEQNAAPTTETKTTKETKSSEEPEETVSADSSILSTKGCLGCHAVEALNLKGGATGPDLSQAFTNVEGKHGKPIDQFLKEPTSAVMSGVIGGNPLSDEEITQLVSLLKEASSK